MLPGVILIAILLPAIAGARRQAVVVSCASNLRQIGLLYHVYAAENRGKYCAIIAENWPVGGLNVNSGEPKDPLDLARVIPEAAAGPGVLWQRRILTDPRILFCPAASEGAARADPAKWWQQPNWVQTFVGYAIYANYRSIEDRNNSLPELVADGSASPAERVLATDTMSTSTDPAPAWSNAGAWINHVDARARFNMVDGAPVRFLGGNILCNDGSVRWRNASEMHLRLTRAYVSFYF